MTFDRTRYVVPNPFIVFIGYWLHRRSNSDRIVNTTYQGSKPLPDVWPNFFRRQERLTLEYARLSKEEKAAKHQGRISIVLL